MVVILSVVALLVTGHKKMIAKQEHKRKKVGKDGEIGQDHSSSSSSPLTSAQRFLTSGYCLPLFILSQMASVNWEKPRSKKTAPTMQARVNVDVLLKIEL